MSLEHSDNCLFIRRQENCNCYLSENERSLGSKQGPFSPATKNGPSDLYGSISEEYKTIIRDFVALNVDKAKLHESSITENTIYFPLIQGEIRVLELSPGHFDDGLHGSLHVVRIDFEYPYINHHKRNTKHAISLPTGDPFWYTALSYTWGAPTFDVGFHLGKATSIQITQSLASALVHLRSETESVFLWIDQICIDQSNVRDKEQQIPLMGMIYSHATNTVIWLGDEGEHDPQIAFDLLQTVHTRLQYFEGEIQPEDLERLSIPASKQAPQWKEVRRLFNRPWFARLWVIQEVVLSLDLYVKCGKAVVAWEDFTLWCATMESSGLRSWSESDLPVPEAQSSLYTTFKLSELRISRHTQGFALELLDSLVASRYADASVAKDKVYGLLGIAQSNILPRYLKDVSIRDVFLEAGLEALPTDLYRLLCCVDAGRAVWPSWIPNWCHVRATESLGFSTKSWSLYSACGPIKDPITGKFYEEHYMLEDDNRSLVLPGVIVDTIASLGEPSDEEPFVFTRDDNIRGNRPWLQYITMVKELISYPTGETIWDAFWQTLAAGKDGSSNGKAPQEYSEILSLIVDECKGRKLRIAGQPYSPRRQKGFFTLKSLTSRKPKQTLDDMRKSFRAAMHWRSFAITEKGYFCLVPRRAKVNDRVVIFERGNVPFVVRSMNEGKFELLGETYVHGIMKGEAFDGKTVHLETIKLV